MSLWRFVCCFPIRLCFRYIAFGEIFESQPNSWFTNVYNAASILTLPFKRNNGILVKECSVVGFTLITFVFKFGLLVKWLFDRILPSSCRIFAPARRAKDTHMQKHPWLIHSIRGALHDESLRRLAYLLRFASFPGLKYPASFIAVKFYHIISTIQFII